MTELSGIDWITLVFSGLSILLSIVALAIGVWQYRLSKKIQMLRPHSNKLLGVFTGWLMRIMRLPEITSTLNFQPHHRPLAERERRADWDFALAHLKTGYKAEYKEIKRLEKEIPEHNKEVKNLRKELLEGLRGTMGKTPYSEKTELEVGHRAGRTHIQLTEKYRTRYDEIIQLAINKGVYGLPESDPKLRKLEKRYQLVWDDDVLAHGTKKYCEKGLAWVKGLLENEDVLEKVKKLHENARSLLQDVVKVRDRLQIKIVDTIKMGGTIKGVCSICK